MPPCEEHSKIMLALGRIEQKCDNTSENISRLDKRINGAFDRVNKHVAEGEGVDGYRERLVKLEQVVMIAAREKLNSTKASQWRIGLITGAPAAILAICKIIEWIKK